MVPTWHTVLTTHRSANPPDFLKHLGVMNDMPTDMDAFFNIHPN
jgi:hypothetical protein